MNLIAQITTVAAAAEGHGNVAMETLIYGIVAAVIFAALGLVVFSYKNVANRHAQKAEAWAARNGHELERGHH